MIKNIRWKSVSAVWDGGAVQCWNLHPAFQLIKALISLKNTKKEKLPDISFEDSLGSHTKNLLKHIKRIILYTFGRTAQELFIRTSFWLGYCLQNWPIANVPIQSEDADVNAELTRGLKKLVLLITPLAVLLIWARVSMGQYKQ